MSFPACGEASDMELVTTRVLNRVLMAYLHQGVPRMSAPRPSLLGRVWRWVAIPIVLTSLSRVSRPPSIESPAKRVSMEEEERRSE